jgi:hypothetical protein
MAGENGRPRLKYRTFAHREDPDRGDGFEPAEEGVARELVRGEGRLVRPAPIPFLLLALTEGDLASRMGPTLRDFQEVGFSTGDCIDSVSWPGAGSGVDSGTAGRVAALCHPGTDRRPRRAMASMGRSHCPKSPWIQNHHHSAPVRRTRPAGMANASRRWTLLRASHR